MNRRATALLAVGFVSFGASPSYAQTREWDPTCGCYIVCVSCSDQAPTPRPSPPNDTSYIPPPDPAVERLRAYLQSFDAASVVLLEEASAALEPWRGLPKPTSEAQLSRRLDEMLAAVWPQLRSTTLEVELLRRQLAYYEGQNVMLRDETARMTGPVARLQEEVLTLSRQVAEADANLAVAQRLESELREFELALIDDRRSERRAEAIIKAFSPRPNVPADRGSVGLRFAIAERRTVRGPKRVHRLP